ncbi:non-ribosomal peptide synthetase subunit [Rothia sp. HMSC066H02]|uniref:non-ribosomal peptide synthetase subunit n=1 Tax=unclassified Rothia (in: high G+C Gram-positive bacteria) TaxID=2689056 RepID=UPI0008A28B24|nr:MULTISPECIES: non-ribosomal peptide synthetase subunit [unclassified Rothia (in: high G+C Gram-positive bacteria)]OFO97844.1 non-ribosomal peptide synthetase subunit [Rothia sp. HMSC065D09]OFP11135.1 non-ribosomal peptide synthetase subunit [Rothia sp. HMSC066H02]
MRIISAVFALVGALPVMPAAVASSLDGATRLYALLIFVLICAAVAFFASLSPSRRRAREIRRQVLQQQQNQAMNQQVPPPQTPPQQVPPQQGPSQQVPPQQVQGAVSYPMHYQPKPAQPGNSAQQDQQVQVHSPPPPQQPLAAPSPLEPMQAGGVSGSSAQNHSAQNHSAQSHSAETQERQSMPQNTPAQPEERPQQETAQQAPESNPAPSDHFSLSTNFKLIPPLENAQRSRYPMVLSASTSEDEVFALPSISGVPQHLLVGTQENHVPLNQRPRRQQIDILENYLMRAVMNLQTLERAQVSPLHSFKETAQADRTVLAAELEETIRVSRLKLSGALEFYTSLPRLEDTPGSFAFARDHALSLSAAVISLTEECFERTFRWRLLEDSLPDSLSDRLYAVRYLRESAQKLAAFVELSEFDRAMQLAETWKKTARKDSNIDKAKVWNEMTEVAFDVLPKLRERALKGVQSTLEFSELFYRTGEDGTHRMLRPEQLSEFELKGVQSTLEERLEKVRLELQDAEFCAAVLSLQARSVIELLEELLQVEQDGVLAEVVTDLRALAHDSPDLAEQSIQTLMFSREQYAPDGEDLPTIGERIRSLSSVPEVLAFVHYEGPVLLVGVSDPYKAFSGEGAEGLLSEEERLSSMPLSVLRTHSRLLRQVLRLQNLRLKLAWVSSCSGYMPLSLVERYYVGPSAADEDLKELTENIEALAELLDARSNSQVYRGRGVPTTPFLWSQMRKQADRSSRLLNHVQFLGWMFASSSRVQVVNGIAQSIHDVDAAEVVGHLMSNLKIARRR